MSVEDKQRQRVFLRERFLRLLTSIWDVPTEFTLHNQTNVRGRFSSADIEALNFLVEDLETPLGTHPAALLRTTDILSLRMYLPKRITDVCRTVTDSVHTDENVSDTTVDSDSRMDVSTQ